MVRNVVFSFSASNFPNDVIIYCRQKDPSKKEEAMEFLNRRAYELNAKETLKILPDDVPICDIEPALKKILSNSMEKVKTWIIPYNLFILKSICNIHFRAEMQ